MTSPSLGRRQQSDRPVLDEQVKWLLKARYNRVGYLLIVAPSTSSWQYVNMLTLSALGLFVVTYILPGIVIHELLTTCEKEPLVAMTHSDPVVLIIYF